MVEVVVVGAVVVVVVGAVVIVGAVVVGATVLGVEAVRGAVSAPDDAPDEHAVITVARQSTTTAEAVRRLVRVDTWWFPKTCAARRATWFLRSASGPEPAVVSQSRTRHRPILVTVSEIGRGYPVGEGLPSSFDPR